MTGKSKSRQISAIVSSPPAAKASPKQPKKSQSPQNSKPKILSRIMEPRFDSTPLAAAVRTGNGTEMAATKEVGIKYVFYDDWDAEAQALNPIFAKYFGNQSTLLNPEASFDVKYFQRIKRVSLYVLPRASNAEVANSTFVAVCGVRGVTAEGSTLQILGNSQTVVHPDFKLGWQRVATWNYSKLFSDTQIVPEYQDGGDLVNTGFVGIYNPDDGSVFDSNVQLRWDIEVANPLPIASEKVAASALFTSPTTTVAPGAIVSGFDYCQQSYGAITNVS